MTIHIDDLLAATSDFHREVMRLSGRFNVGSAMWCAGFAEAQTSLRTSLTALGLTDIDYSEKE